jgi:FkbM family methyltransferase
VTIAFRSGWRDTLLDRLTSAARLLPRGRTTAHRVFWHALGAPRRFVGRVDGQLFCVDALDTDISTTIYLRQEWEPPSTAVWKALLAPGQVVVDVGANKGWFSLLAAPRVKPDGRVISYEALPRNVADLEVTSAANLHHHWRTRPVAASDRPGVAQLVSPRDDHGTGWGSLQRDIASGDNVAVDVQLVTLAEDLASQGVDRVDLLKMDIEGHELAALKGLLSMLREQRVARLLVELHRKHLGREGVDELIRMVLGCGYEARLLDESAMSMTRWRAAADGAGDRSVIETMPPISGPDDSRIRDRGYFKLLFTLPIRES